MGKVLYWALYNHILAEAGKNRQGILCKSGLCKSGLRDRCLEKC